MTELLEDVDLIHEAIARFYKDDVADPRCNLDKIFKDLFSLKSKLYLKVELKIEPVTNTVAKEGFRTRSRVKFSLSANTQKASGLIIHKLSTVRVISNLDISRLMELPWNFKSSTERNKYLVGGYFQYVRKPR